MQLPHLSRILHRSRLKDGTRVVIRPIRADDGPHLLTIFAHLGTESRYRRFYRPVDQLPAERTRREAEQMALDCVTVGRGWLAFADLPGEPHAPLGGIRYVRMGDRTAEISVTVRDDMHNKGVGSLLMQRLVREARRDGLRRLVGLMQDENRPAWRLLQKTGLPMRRTVDGRDTYFELLLEGD